MTRTGRIVFALVASILAFLLLLGAAGAWWWKNHSSELFAAGDAAFVEGSNFGAAADSNGCVHEAFLRFDACEDFGCQVANNVFLQACLNAATPTAEFCRDVPLDDFMRSVTWRAEMCVEGRRQGTLCQSLVGQIQEYCEQQ